MTKINVLFNQNPEIEIRVIAPDDENIVKKSKKSFPFMLKNDVIVTVTGENELKFSFKINEGYIWNGADIPRFLWRIIGSKTDNAFLVASMVHDYLLQFKKTLIEDTLHNSLTANEYRTLTTEVFCELLKQSGTGKVKARIMSGAVGMFQKFFNRKNWK